MNTKDKNKKEQSLNQKAKHFVEEFRKHRNRHKQLSKRTSH